MNSSVDSPPRHGRGARTEVPAVVAEAGPFAAQQYAAFFDAATGTPATRAYYRSVIGRFFAWAESRGRPLSAITANEAADFVRDVFPTPTRHRVQTKYLSAIRGIFRHLAAAGVLATNPLETTLTRGAGQLEPRRRQPLIPLAQLKEAVLDLDQTYTEDCEFFHAGLVVLAPLSLGTIAPEPISEFTGVPLPLVQAIAERLLRYGCWSADGAVEVGSYDPDDWGQSMILSILVATGYVETRPQGAAVGGARRFVLVNDVKAITLLSGLADEPSPPEGDVK